MQSSSTYTRAYAKNKKICIEKICIVAYSEQSEQSEGEGEQVWLVLNLYERSEGWCHPRKIWLFLLSFKFANSIPSTETDTKLFYKYKHIFFLKTGKLILNWVPLYFSNNHMPERLSSQSTLPNSLVNWEQFGGTT